MKSNLPIDEAIYEEGYNQAIKDLALTWEDIKLIEEIMNRIINYEYYETYIHLDDKEFYEEVLRRFNKKRKEI